MARTAVFRLEFRYDFHLKIAPLQLACNRVAGLPPMQGASHFLSGSGKSPVP
jgi:hypothetical protein